MSLILATPLQDQHTWFRKNWAWVIIITIKFPQATEKYQAAIVTVFMLFGACNNISQKNLNYYTYK